jgi:hypothetical protein
MAESANHKKRFVHIASVNVDILGSYAWQSRALTPVFEVATRTREQFGVLDFEATPKWIIRIRRRRRADNQLRYKDLRTNRLWYAFSLNASQNG